MQQSARAICAEFFMSSSIKIVDVLCMRGSEIIATYEFGIAAAADASSSCDFDRQALIREANTNLSNEGLAEPSSEGITFEIKER
jgi:hypothetical protein